jgi:hypothetical protein
VFGDAHGIAPTHPHGHQNGTRQKVHLFAAAVFFVYIIIADRIITN